MVGKVVTAPRWPTGRPPYVRRPHARMSCSAQRLVRQPASTPSL